MSEQAIESLKSKPSKRSGAEAPEQPGGVVLVDYQGRDDHGFEHRAPWVVATPSGNLLFCPGANAMTAEALAKAKAVESIGARFKDGQLRAVNLAELRPTDLTQLVKRTTSPDALELILAAELDKPVGGRADRRRDLKLVTTIEQRLAGARRNAPPDLS